MTVTDYQLMKVLYFLRFEKFVDWNFSTIMSIYLTFCGRRLPDPPLTSTKLNPHKQTKQKKKAFYEGYE